MVVVWIPLFLVWHRPMPKAISTFRNSAHAWPVPVASLISARTPRPLYLSAPSLPVILIFVSLMANSSLHAKEDSEIRQGEVPNTAPSVAVTPLNVARPCFMSPRRCVFRLTPEGIELIEIAPGIDPNLTSLARWISDRRSSAI